MADLLRPKRGVALPLLIAALFSWDAGLFSLPKTPRLAGRRYVDFPGHHVFGESMFLRLFGWFVKGVFVFCGPLLVGNSKEIGAKVTHSQKCHDQCPPRGPTNG